MTSEDKFRGRATPVARRNFAWGTIEVLLRRVGRTAAGDDVMQVVAPVEYATIDENSAVDPTFKLTEAEARELMDELWAAGVRPTAVGTPQTIDATRAHLEDMRKLVQQLLPVALDRLRPPADKGSDPRF